MEIDRQSPTIRMEANREDRMQCKCRVELLEPCTTATTRIAYQQQSCARQLHCPEPCSIDDPLILNFQQTKKKKRCETNEHTLNTEHWSDRYQWLYVGHGTTTTIADSLPQQHIIIIKVATRFRTAHQ
jgi:hypothetical protein